MQLYSMFISQPASLVILRAMYFCANIERIVEMGIAKQTKFFKKKFAIMYFFEFVCFCPISFPTFGQIIHLSQVFSLQSVSHICVCLIFQENCLAILY